MVLGWVTETSSRVLGRNNIIFWVDYTWLGHAFTEVGLLHPYTTAPGLPALGALALDTPLPRAARNGAIHPVITTLGVGAYDGRSCDRLGIKWKQQVWPVIYSAHRQTMYVLGLKVKTE